MTTAEDREKILQYWRDVVIAGNFPAVKFPYDTELDESAIRTGRVSSAVVKYLFGNKKPESPDAEEEAESVLSVLIGLKPFRSSGGKEVAALLYLPALLDKEGHLYPAAKTTPWIAREYLSPSSSDFLTIGSLEDFDTALAAASFSAEARWHDYIAAAKNIFSDVSGTDIDAYVLPKYLTAERDVEAYIIPFDRHSSGTAAILDLYATLLSDPSDSPTLDRLIEGIAPLNAIDMHGRTKTALDAETIRLLLNHTGHMSDRFGLAASQRQALMHGMDLGHGDILAVQGPPGTGKTTLLQSVIASLWVNAALGGHDQHPPVILGASTNNRAVINILDSFKYEEGDQLLTQRWLPKAVKEYGLFFPSYEQSNQSDIAQNYHIAISSGSKGNKTPWNGLPQKIENSDFLSQAKREYLEKSRAFFSGEKEIDIEQTIDRLQQSLKSHKKLLGDVLGKIDTLLTQKHFERLMALSPIFSKAARDEQEAEECQKLENAFNRSKEIHVKEKRLQDESKLLIYPKNFFLRLLNFIPPVRQRRVYKAFLHYNENGDSPLENEASFETLLKSRLDGFWKNASIALFALRETLSNQFLKIIDKTLRYEMFHLAARYWEGRWLLEMDRVLHSQTPEPLGAQSKDLVCNRFRRWAMLTPCFISTLHNAPKVFQFYDGKNRNLLDFIDLLIIDEAGQIAPEIGVPAFALAKKALVVGDIYQIEPIAGIGPEMDKVKLKSLKLDFDAVNAMDKTSSAGNIMAMASHATSVTIPGALEKGLFLAEHRRCKDDLISYCNELLYHGRLIPCVGNTPNGVTPIWGYAHLTYRPMRVGKSFKNPKEADAIAEWVERHAAEWMAAYKKPLHDIIAVVTPFAAQRNCLKSAFADRLAKTFGKDADKIVIGTVHSMQGAERPIILFSPTVNFDKSKKPFFDGTPNMLNVAVSRAKDSFLVFGDMRLFSYGGWPTSLLGKYLFSSQDNDITDILKQEVADAPDLTPETRLTTHAEHENALLDALRWATHRVLIVSPYLSVNRLTDTLLDAMSDAVRRKIRVVVVTSSDMNRDSSPGNPLRDNFIQAKHRLQQAGCTLIEMAQVHNKTLAVDEKWLIDGSYNWLSAVSNINSIYHNREISQRYTGDDVATHIAKEWQAFGFDKPSES